MVREERTIRMRRATESDLTGIVAIYNSTIPTRQSTADTGEVSVESKRGWFRKHTPDKRPILVHEIEGGVSFEPFYGRLAYDHTAEISIYVASEYREKGLGHQLLQEAIEMTPSLGIKTLIGYIFAHNEPSLRLFRSFGFEEWGKLPDVAVMDGKEYSLSIVGKRINA
jgi:phosphinothricin acetyltransferase